MTDLQTIKAILEKGGYPMKQDYNKGYEKTVLYVGSYDSDVDLYFEDNGEIEIQDDEKEKVEIVKTTDLQTIKSILDKGDQLLQEYKDEYNDIIVLEINIEGYCLFFDLNGNIIEDRNFYCCRETFE